MIGGLAYPPYPGGGLRRGKRGGSGGDATSGIVAPTTSAEFTALGETAFDHTFGCQDASGNLAATLGTPALASQGAGAALYQQPVAGWSRKSVGSTADGDVRSWRYVTLEGPNPTLGSVLWAGYLQFLALPAANRMVLAGAGSSPNLLVNLLTTGALRLSVNSVAAEGAYNYVDGAVHPLVIQYDKTNSLARLFTDKERITGTYSSLVGDSNKGVGHVVGAATALYRALWLGADGGASAERDVKLFLQRCGWAVTGY